MKQMYFRKLLFLFFFLPLWISSSQAANEVSVEFQVAIPFALQQNAQVYLVGDTEELGKWQPDFIPLHKQSALRYSVTLSLPKGPIQFKFTLGKWEMVEKGPKGEELANRTLQIDGAKKVSFVVQTWNNYHMLSQGLPTWSGTVEEIAPIYSDYFKNYRKIWVYLPPSYSKNTTQKYPVLYMHDGNNVFNSKSSFGGVEWSVDESVQQLIGQNKIKEVIVVAVANTMGRMDEYTPVSDPNYGGGKADEYGKYLVLNVKPVIDKNYRTLSNRENTGIMGSSLGGLVSIYLALKYPQVFSKIGVVSPSIWWSNKYILRAVQQASFQYPFQIWLDMGTKESSQDRNRNGVPDSLDDSRELKDLLIQKGFVLGKSLEYYEDQGAAHNEYYWSKRVGKPLVFFYSK